MILHDLPIMLHFKIHILSTVFEANTKVSNTRSIRISHLEFASFPFKSI